MCRKSVNHLKQNVSAVALVIIHAMCINEDKSKNWQNEEILKGTQDKITTFNLVKYKKCDFSSEIYKLRIR